MKNNSSGQKSKLSRASSKLFGKTIKWGFEGLTRAGKLHPAANLKKHGVECLPNIAYGPRPEHRLDVWRPTAPGDYPAMLYIHGGGFHILSKDTHWGMGLAFARKGYVVFNIDYRLAPEHPYPAAIQDSFLAWEWMLEHARSYGADTSRVLLGGESAGANLSAALTISACWERTEPWAARIWDLGVVPERVIAPYGIYQVSDVARYWRRDETIRPELRGRFETVSRYYLGEDQYLEHIPGEHDLADPLMFLERAHEPKRPLPPFFLPVGTRDDLLWDNHRMTEALSRLGAWVDAPEYEGEIHAFNAFLWREKAKQCWRDTYTFLDLEFPSGA